jgi:hypothetical protein
MRYASRGGRTQGLSAFRSSGRSPKDMNSCAVVKILDGLARSWPVMRHANFRNLLITHSTPDFASCKQSRRSASPSEAMPGYIRSKGAVVALGHKQPQQLAGSRNERERVF